MSDIQTLLFPKNDQFSTYADPDPIKILTDVEEVIRSLDEEEDESAFCSVVGENDGRIFSSVSTEEVVALLAVPEPGAPKKRGRRPKPRIPGEMPVKKINSSDALWSDEKGKKTRRKIDPSTCEREYSEDEVEFMNALNLYKDRNGRPFPTCSEMLEVLLRLGYVKMPPAHEGAPNEPEFAAPLPVPSIAEYQEIAAPWWPENEVAVYEA